VAIDRLARWRLILGSEAEKDLQALATAGGALAGGGGRGAGGGLLPSDLAALDAALEPVYASGEGYVEPTRQDDQDPFHRYLPGARGKGWAATMPKVATWLDDIRKHFPNDVVAVIQRDAIERKGLTQLLLEPENLARIEPSIDLVATLLALKDMVPAKAKEAARDVVQRVVDEIRKRLESRLERAVRGALDRSRHSPLASLPNMDWKRTIQRNLKNYDPKRKVVIPERFFFFSRQQRRKLWNIIIAMDQSGSMTNSLIYGGIMGAILASLPALETHVVAFNQEHVVDLTEKCSDPVDLLFGTQMGGAEDYWMASTYCEQFIHDPRRTIFVLLADLYDTSPNETKFVQKMEEWVADGVKPIGLLAISDSGVPEYNKQLAEKLQSIGMPCFGCTPDRLPDLLEAALKGHDLSRFAGEGKKRTPV
jgi:hypothetical protein